MKQQTQSKTALVLAGGGLTGAVYEIGALRAIDDMLIDRSVTDFDLYVGTSAGALVAACLANRLTPQEMMQVFDGTHLSIEPVKRRHIFQPNSGEFWRRALGMPNALAGAWSHYFRHINDMTVFDLIWSLLETLPSAMYDGAGLETFVKRTFQQAGRTDNFADLARKLYIIATDLDNGERAVFGPGEMSDIPISKAVAASSALPIVYKPVRIGKREYIDGGIKGTASLDLAIEQGANLVICINPLVPFDNTQKDSIPFLGPDGGYLSDKGVQAIVNQVARIMMQSGLHYHIKQLRRAHPEVDIILIEPNQSDYQMFFYNIMRYSARQTIAEHGYETVTLGLAEKHSDYEEILTRHGIPINKTLAMAELAEIRQSEYNPQVIKSVLEKRDMPAEKQNGHSVSQTLAGSLRKLDVALDLLG